jgi:preprotein translocase subunit YajC
MTDLEIVLFIAFVFMFWAYRYQHKRADYFKGLLLAVGAGVVTIEVDQDRKTSKLGMPK